MLAKQDTSRVTLTVDVLSSLYLTHAEAYSRKGEEPTAEVDCIRAALKLLIAFAGRTRAAGFGPRQFRQFRDSLVKQRDRRATKQVWTLSRQCINKCISATPPAAVMHARCFADSFAVDFQN